MTQGALQSDDRRLTGSAIEARSGCAANGFLQAGVGEGAAIAMMLHNDFAFIEVMLAASIIGAYAVPINSHFTAAEVNQILADCGARILVIHADLLCDLAPALVPLDTILCVATPPSVAATYAIPARKQMPPPGYREWEEWLGRFDTHVSRVCAPRGVITYTSGTTGRPKGVKRDPVSAANLEPYQRLRGEWFGFRPGMRTAIVGPLYHSVQATYALAALRTQGLALLLPKFDAQRLLRLIGEYQLTHLHLVPTMMSRLLELPEHIRANCNLASLEFVVHGAAPCPPHVKRRMIAWWGPIIHEYYGTTEAGMVSRASSEEWLAREGTVGRPWSGRTVRIYDAQGRQAAADAVGELYMSLGILPNFTYHNADAKRREIERDGLVTNGDMGYLDRDGYLFLCDRKHDMAISGGMNLYPAEVEAVLLEHPAVYDCAVFPVPHADLGEVLAAAVQLRVNHAVTADELANFARTRLARIKVPRHLEICDALPRDASGKVFKKALRAAYAIDTAATRERQTGAAATLAGSGAAPA